MSWINVKVTWDETWRREYVADVHEGDLRDWAGIPEGPIPSEQIVEFLEAQEDDTYWHPGTVVSECDEFLYLDIDTATPEAGDES